MEFKVYNYDIKTKFFFGICEENDKNKGFYMNSGSQINLFESNLGNKDWKIEGNFLNYFVKNNEA